MKLAVVRTPEKSVVQSCMRHARHGDHVSQRTFRNVLLNLLPSVFAATVGLAAVVVVSSAARLQFGVDFTDEAYYAAIPYRFVLGDKPYVSELNVRQNAGLLVVPVVKGWVVWSGGSDGLILALRYSYLALRVALAAFAVFALWNLVPPALAVASALLFGAFVLFSIPALGYNTLAGAAGSAALLSLLLWRQTYRGRYVAASSAFALVAAFVHPAVLPVAAVTIGSLIWLSPAPSQRRTAAVYAAVVVAVGGVAAIAAAAALGRANIEHLIQTASVYAGPPASLERLVQLPRQLLELSNGGTALAVLWLGLWFPRRMPAFVLSTVAGVYVVLAMLANNEVALVWLAVASLPITYHAWRAGADATLPVAAMLAITGGLFVALFSTNGIVNAAVGAEIAAIAFFIGLSHILKSKTSPTARTPELVPVALATLAVLGFAVGQWRNVYRDDPIIRLTQVVPDGPYRGLRTTRKKLDYLEGIQGALRENQGDKGSLLAFNTLTAAYLMVPLRPALATTWVVDYPQQYVVDMRRALAGQVSVASRPILVLQLFHVPNTTWDDPSWTYFDDVMMQAVMAEKPRTILSTQDFALHVIGGASRR